MPVLRPDVYIFCSDFHEFCLKISLLSLTKDYPSFTLVLGSEPLLDFWGGNWYTIL